ncbi:MAG: site-2 protease family protein [Burkholderiaceae bacterium]|jgi:Zn-dependent protease|nr:site-2 protease family protein [Burkholderiaceae bacterium]
MDPFSLIQTVLIYAVPVLFAITLHEAAHGYIARHLGDDTAWTLGRVTLNPLRHIDPIGTILIPLALYVVTHGAFLFGYAKPVPVNFRRLRNPKRDMIWVALAGPASNFVQALLWALLLVLLIALGVETPFFRDMVRTGITVNLVVCAFNLFPLPPLDGGRILAGLLPPGQAQVTLARIEPYGFYIVMVLVMLGIIGDWWLNPLIQIGGALIKLLLSPLIALLH